MWNTGNGFSKAISSKHYGNFAFESGDVVNLDLFSGHRLFGCGSEYA
jgi:hypothetical protein